SMINKDTNGRIIIQSRKRNIAADTDPANTANRDLHHDYCLFEQEEDNVIDWGKPSISFKALHLLSNGDKPQTKKDKTKKDKKKKDKQRKKKQKYSYDK